MTARPAIFEPSGDRVARVAAGAAVAAPVFVVLGVWLSARGLEGYSHRRDPLSALGAVGAPNGLWFFASNLVVAACLGLFLTGVRRLVPIGRWAFAAVAVAAIATVGLAAARCSPDCPGWSHPDAQLRDKLHIVFGIADLAAVTIAAASVAIFGLGGGWNRLRVASSVVAVALLAGAVWMFIAGDDLGLAQRSFYVVAWTWFVLLGAALASRRVRSALGAFA